MGGGGGATFRYVENKVAREQPVRTVSGALRSMGAKLREAADGMMDMGGGGHDGGKLLGGGESRKHTDVGYHVRT